jgi:hypothetical protein
MMISVMHAALDVEWQVPALGVKALSVYIAGIFPLRASSAIRKIDADRLCLTVARHR